MWGFKTPGAGGFIITILTVTTEFKELIIKSLNKLTPNYMNEDNMIEVNDINYNDTNSDHMSLCVH